MRSVHAILTSFAVTLLVTALSRPVEAGEPRFQVLYNFAGGNDGEDPQAGLVADSAGNLYGTTAGGGSSTLCFLGCGIVFEVSPPTRRGGTWIETVLHRFTGQADGSGPLGKLVRDGQGNVYGTTFQGGDLNVAECTDGQITTGCGVVFEFSPPSAPGGTWTETILHDFEGSDGGYPAAGLVFDTSGNLYGTTSGGGAFPYCIQNELEGCGVVFELSPPSQNGGQWTYTVLYSFTGANDGSLPLSDLSFDSAGNLYGTTSMGGGNGGGVVFELVPPHAQGGGWTDVTLYSFPANSDSRAGVAVDAETNLFGTTSKGGSAGDGTVFELSPSSNGVWTESIIYQFHATSAKYPVGTPTLDSLGYVYGTASGGQCGALYRLQNRQGGWLEDQYSFPSHPKGGACSPFGALIFGKENALYGTTTSGGTCAAGGCGTVFGILP